MPAVLTSAWRKIAALAQRELGFFFNSPIAWIVTTLFLVLSGALLFVFDLPDEHNRNFFELGEANLRALFGPSTSTAVGGLPLVLAFLVPAITMRLIAEEKRTGTLELLVTWPLSERHIILGKYLGALGFIALMLLASFPLVGLVASLGALDWGLVWGGYLGLFLVAATYAALGLLASTWTRNQIVAYLVSASLCAFVYFVDGLLGLLGPDLRTLFAALSVKAHAQNLARGILDLRDVAFYLSLSALALWGAVTSLSVRAWQQGPAQQRRQGWLNVSLSFVAVVLIAIVANLLLSQVRVRWDWSHNRVNLLSEASEDAVSVLPELEIKLYISPDLPEDIQLSGRTIRLQGLPAKLRDKLEEYVASGEDVRLSLVQEDLLNQAERVGLTPFAGQEATLKGDHIELSQYVLGVSFHWRSATEVWPLAIEPNYYEFEITRRLLRLKEKAEQSLVMREQLHLGQDIATRAQACLDALMVPEAPQGLGPVLGKAPAQAQLSALKSQREALYATCSGFEELLERVRHLSAPHPQLTRLRFIAEALDSESETFANTLSLPDGALDSLDTLSATHERLQVLARALVDEKKELDDSPGRRVIGFVCNAKTFCPFPEERPLLPVELTSALSKQNPALKQAIGVLDRISQELNFTLQQLNQALFRARGYDLVRVDLNQPLPLEVKSLIVLGAQGDFSPLELYQLDQHLLRGGHLAIFLSPFEPRLQLMDSKGSFEERARFLPRHSNVTQLLEQAGLRPQGSMLVDPSTHGELNYYVQFTRQGERQIPFQRGSFPYPALPSFSDLDTSHPLVRASSVLTLPWPTPLTLEPREALTQVVLARSSEQARLLPTSFQPIFPPQALTRALQEMPAAGPQVVAALVEGEFTSLFKDRAEPELSPELAKQTDRPARLDQGQGRLLVIGSDLGLEPLSYQSIFEGFELSMLTGQDGGLDHMDRFRSYQVNFQNWSLKLSQIEHLLSANIPFLHNVLDWLTQRDALAELRSKQYVSRPLRILTSEGQTWMQTLGLVLPTLIFLGLGLVRYALRQRRMKRLHL